jgi:hypothetical protein
MCLSEEPEAAELSLPMTLVKLPPALMPIFCAEETILTNKKIVREKTVFFITIYLFRRHPFGIG